MSGIITKFGTPEPVAFKEKGCDTEFAARISGALYINEYDGTACGGNLPAFAAEKIEEHLAKWNKDDKLLGVDGKEMLELMLNYDLMEAGVSGSSRIDDITITEETDAVRRSRRRARKRSKRQSSRMAR